MRFLSFLFFILAMNTPGAGLLGQCTILNQTAVLTSSSCAPAITPCTVCPGNTLTLAGSGSNLPPGGCVNWYYSDQPNFDPYAGQGTLMGCSPISGTPSVPCSTCPTLLGIFVDACGTEEDNEFLLMTSGSGFVVDQLSVTYDAGSIGGAGNASIGGGCGWQTPTPATLASVQTICPSATIVEAGPGVSVPPNVPVIVFTSSNFSFAYNWASLCPFAPVIYIMQSDCQRTSGAFPNGPGIGNVTTSISLNCGCSGSLTYNRALLLGGNGSFVTNSIPPLPVFYLNAGCGLPAVPFPPPPTPPQTTFSLNYTVPASLCNGGPYYVTAIPDPLDPSCAQTQTNYLQFDVVCPQATLGSDQICSGSGTYNLNDLLVTPMSGTWSGPQVTGNNFNPTGLSGVQNFQFTPTGACATSSSTTIAVNAAPTATISAPASVCQGDNVPLTFQFTGQSPWVFDLLQNGNLVNSYVANISPITLNLPVSVNSVFSLDNLGDALCTTGTSNTVNVQVVSPANGTLSALGATSVCNGGSTTVQVQFAGGAPPYTFEYAINGVNQTAISTNSNPYTLTITPNGTTTVTLASVSSSGCTGNANGSVQITTGGSITGVLQSGSESVCLGETITLNYTFTGTPPITFTPTINGLSQAPVVSPGLTYAQTITPPLGITTYGLDVVSANGCSGTGSGFFDVSVSTPPTASLSGAAVSCNPGSAVSLDVDFTGTGPFTFVYSANGIAQPPVMTGLMNYNLMVSPSANTTYQLLSVQNAACTGTTTGTATVTINSDPLIGTLTGGGQVCPGGPSDTLVFTFQGDAPYTFVYSINGVNQAPITTNASTYTVFQHPAMGTQYVLESLTNGVCDGVVSGSVWILVFTPPTAQLMGGGVFCGSANTPVQIDLTGTAPFNIGYTINGVIQPLITTSDDPYILPVNTTSNLSFLLDTVYSTGCPGAVNTSPVNYTIHPILSYSNFMAVCSPSTNTYTIQATLSGTPPYTLVSGTGSFAGNQFLSSALSLTNPNYNIVINDVNNCGPVTLNGTVNCNCTTNAGTMQQLALTDCTTDIITATHNGDQVLDANDTLVYILHSNPAYPFGTIYAQAATPGFAFQPGMMAGTTYYISALAGNKNATGVDTTDLCRSVAPGTPVMWLNPPTAVLSGNAVSCPGQDIPFEVMLTGSPTFNLTYTVNGAPVSTTTTNQLFIINTNLQQTTTYTLVSVSDQYCTGTVSGNATVTIHAPVTAGPVNVSCNIAAGSYQVSFGLVGTAPFTVLSGNGSFVGNQFTSAVAPLGSPSYSFSFTDFNRCDTLVVSGIANCNCTTSAGSVLTDTLKVCGMGQATAQHQGNSVLDANDTLMYVLHSQPGYPFGTVFSQSLSPSFTLQPGMSVGTLYYITAVAGNELPNGLVDTADFCRSTSQSVPVRWLAAPTATLSGTYHVCPGQQQALAIQLTGGAPYQLTYSVNGTPITVTANNPTVFNISTNLLSDGVYQLLSVSSQGCTGTASGTATVNVHATPVISGVNLVCAPDQQSYTVAFFVNHDSLSSVTITGSVAGNFDTLTGQFTSGPIPIANTWNAVVTDLVWLCGQDSVGGNPPNCNCPNSAGAFGNDSLNLCNNLPATVPAVTGAVLEPGDTLVYVLATSTGPPSWTILGVNSVPSFVFNAGLMTPGQTYYILALVGDKLPSGAIDLGDPCLDIASGPRVVWRTPVTAFLSGNTQICQGDTAELVISFVGQAPFTYTYLANAQLQGPFTSATDTARLLLNPGLSVNYAPGTVTDATGCQGSFSGGGALSVLFPPNVIEPALNCDAVTQTYTYSFKITNGAAPNPVYSITGTAGSLTDTLFTSTPIPWGTAYLFTVTDPTTGCSLEITNTPNCQCQADAGTLTTLAITACPTELVFVQSAGDFNIPGGNDLQYALVADTLAFPVGIISISTTPQFTAPAGVMPGQTYYIVAFVGDTLATGAIDLTDPCLDRSNAVPITYTAAPTATLSGSASVCPGGSGQLLVTFTGTAPFVFSYSVNGGNPISVPASSLNFPVSSTNVLQDQTFTLLSVTDANCPGTVSGTGTIDVLEAPTAQLLVTDSTLCAGDSVEVTVVLSGAASYTARVQIGALTVDLTEVTTNQVIRVPVFQPVDVELLSFTAQGNNCPVVLGAPNALSVSAVALDTIIFDFNGFGVSCAGASDGSMQVLALSGQNPFEYAWNTGASSALIQNVPAGTYTATVTDAFGCQDSLTVVLTEPAALIPNWATENPTCPADSTGIISLQAVNGGFGPFTYSLNGEPATPIQQDTLTLTGLPTGTYNMQLTDANGCQEIDTFELEFTSELAFDLGNDTTINIGDTVLLSPVVLAGAISQHQWSPTYAVFDSTSVSTLATPVVPTLYTLTGTNSDGCTATDSVLIFVRFYDRVNIANVIKPGAPGNDLLFIYAGSNVVGFANFKLYDRWGALMVTVPEVPTNGSIPLWDGQWKGKTVNPGVYVYTLEVEYVNGSKEILSGDITVVR